MIRRHLCALLLILACLISPSLAAAGSKFYLTIERSYGPDERPRIRLDFLDLREPIQLRVLRPKNVDRFLEGQLQLSRAYEEPRSQINPSHYLNKGINKVSSPLFELRGLLSPKFRDGFGGNEFNNPLAMRSSKDLLTVPKEITQGPPADFEVVRQIFIDLQRGGEIAKGLYDWDDYYWAEKYNIRQIELDPLPDGVYLVQAVQDKQEGQALLQISSLGVQVKQSTEELLFRVVDRALQPVSGAEISIRDSRGVWRVLAERTDSGGSLFYRSVEGPLDGRLVAKVSAAGGRLALVETDFLPATSNSNSVFLLTDRPIFKPGENFSFKGMIRETVDGKLLIPSSATTQAKIVLENTTFDYRSAPLLVPLTAFGTFSGELSLSAVQPPGLYKLVAELDSAPYAGELRVRDYEKPTFYLELVERDPTINLGQPFRLKVRARRYSGGIPADARYEVFLYRKRFETPQFVTEAGGAISAGSDYSGSVRSASSLIQPVRLYSSVEERLQQLGDSALGGSWESAPQFDEQGEASISFIVPQVRVAKGNAAEDNLAEWTYSVVVRAQDPFGRSAYLSENIYRTRSEVVASIGSQESVISPGSGVVTYLVKASYPDGRVAARVKGDLILRMRSADAKEQALGSHTFETAEDGVARIDVAKPNKVGKLIAKAQLLKLADKDLHPIAESVEAIAIIPGDAAQSVDGGESLQLFTNGTILSPGEKRAIFVALPEHWGRGAQGPLWQTIAGERIFHHETRNFQGRGVWLDVEAKPEYGSGFYYTVAVPVRPGKLVEETMGFRIVPKDKLLTIAVQPEATPAAPLKPYKLRFQVNDASGAPASQVELAVSVIDRAVYAVQPEFRPEITEFFYPLPRVNVATFTSDELQGYGYADEIARPNFSLAALKSQSKPQKRAMRDTAGWFPHVVTDTQGQAEVTLDMPANITEWLVTAVAIDADGRMGEGSGRFNSAADIVVEPRVPQFLREGDLVEGHLLVENRTQDERRVNVDMIAGGGVNLSRKDEASQLLLPPNKQGNIAVSVAGNIAKDATANVEGQGFGGLIELRLAIDETSPGTGRDVRLGGPSQFELRVFRDSLRLPFRGSFDSGNGAITFPELPVGISPHEVQLFVSRGITGAVLALSSRLVSYPWGCTEQLVHTTLPNLVLLDALKRGGVTEETLLHLPDSLGLRDAKAYAELGVQRLSRNQKSDGAFGLWPGDSGGSLPVSLLAASALRLAKGAGLKSAEKPLIDVSTYLSQLAWESRGSVFEAKDRPYRGWLLANAAKNDLCGSLRRQCANYLKEIRTDENARLDELVYASQIMRNVKESWWLSEEIDQDSDLVLGRLAERIRAELRKTTIDAQIFPVTGMQEQLGFQYNRQTVVSAALGELSELENTTEFKKEFLPLINKLLAGVRYTNYSTFDSANLVFAMRTFVEKEYRELVAGANSTAVQAAPKLSGLTTPAGSTESIELAIVPGGYYLDPKLLAGKVLQRGSILENVPSDSRVLLTAFADVPFNQIRGISQELQISRKLYRVGPTGAEPIPDNLAVRVGDILISEVAVKRGEQSSRYSAASRFIVVEDSVPALGEVIEDDREILTDANILRTDPDSWWSKVKSTIRYKERTERVLEVHPGASFNFYQAYHIQFRGAAVIPPARAYDMYAADVMSVTESIRLKAE